MPISRFRPIARRDGWVLALGGKKGSVPLGTPPEFRPSDDGTNYFNASMPAPKLI